MLLFVIGFLLGDVYVQTCRVLPPLPHLFYLFIASLLLFCVLRRFVRYALIFPAIMLGILWTTWYASSILSFTLPQAIEGQPVLVRGFIVSMPKTSVWDKNFLFELEAMNDIPIPSFYFKPIIRLAWPNTLSPSPSFKVGDEWQFKVKLKRIHGTQSPGAFDYEAYALQQHLRATGAIIDPVNLRLNHSIFVHPIDQLREKLRDQLTPLLPQTTTAPWLMALMIGERDNLPQADWHVLRATGTNHLMAIAGLHIGCLAGFCYFLASFLWRRSSYLTLRMPAQYAGQYAAVIAAILYSVCAGFALPTERAFIMLLIASILICAKRRASVWHIWAFALWIVLVCNPLITLSESFWLSFATIALLIYGLHGRLHIKSLWWHWGRAQWVISIGLIPLSLLLFQSCSAISFIANMFAIPYLTFLILPFCFLSLLFLFPAPHLTTLCLLIADKNMHLLWMALSWLAAHPFALWTFSLPSLYYAYATIIAVCLFLLPRGMPGRLLSIIWILPLLTYHASQPANGEMRVSVLDVGQGLSTVIQTSHHVLVYDAGPNLGGRDAGQDIVLPYLISAHIKKIDRLVISHGDNDHIGGAEALLHALPIESIKTSAVTKILTPVTTACLAGDAWEWDGVKFAFIYPSKMDYQDNAPQHNAYQNNTDKKSSNDTSCVLRIDNGKQVILLPGDIEKKAEHQLLTTTPHLLAANLLIAPHHGSKTSGGKPFITAVHPNWVIFATGYRNRYHFPHPSVLAAYKAADVQTYNMPSTGTLTFQFANNDNPPIIQAYRLTHLRYWFGT